MVLSDRITPLLFLCYPWIAKPDTEETGRFLAQQRERFRAAGFDGERVKAQLEEVLVRDKHLGECCPSAGELAHLCDIFFIVSSLPLFQTPASEEKLNELFENLSQVVYGQGRFKTVALSHIFNFDSDQPSLHFGNIRVERLDAPTIATVLGEMSLGSFIHPPGCGEYFIVTEHEGRCDNHVKLIVEEWQKAGRFVQVLQYLKDGVVHTDYAVPYFLPPWVNQIRKWGIFFIGNPRRVTYEGGRKFYRIDQREIAEATRWWRAYQSPTVFERLRDEQNTMRQTGIRAGDYYEYNQTDEKPVGRLIALAIALEALFSPTDQGELTFRIAQYVSQLVGKTPSERIEIFEEIKSNFYVRRSKLIHGQYNVADYYAGRFVTHEECDRWASIVRRAILRFLVLYLRGTSDRKELLERFGTAALDSSEAEKVRAESAPEEFLETLEPSASSAAP
jgi:Apea-like HEPN